MVSATSVGPSPAGIGPVWIAAARSALGSLAAAVRARDAPAYRATITTGEPSFAPIADRLFANLSALPLSQLSFSVDGGPVPLDGVGEQNLPGGWTQAGTVTWRLGNDTGPAVHRLWLTFAPAGRVARLAGISTDPPSGQSAGSVGSGAQPVPLWLLGPVQVASGHGATVVVADGRAGPWLSRAEAARAAVSAAVGTDLRRSWRGRLVVEVPGSQADFERVLGGAAGSYRQVAAVTRPEGPDPAEAAVRVVVNPVLAGPLTPAGLDVLLTHEATHVATRSALSRAPMWLVEGFADYVAYDRVGSAAPAAESLVRSAVRQQGLPTDFPAETSFRPDAADLAQTYAMAWAACRFVADTYSPEALQRLYRDADSGRSLSAAIRRQLGVSQSALIDSWRGWLEHQSESR
jgi:hypothetical protein